LFFLFWDFGWLRKSWRRRSDGEVASRSWERGCRGFFAGAAGGGGVGGVGGAGGGEAWIAFGKDSIRFFSLSRMIRERRKEKQ